MKVRLNLSTTPPPNRRPFFAAAAIVGVVGLALFVILARAAYGNWSATRELRSEISGWQSEVRAQRARQDQLRSYFESPQAKQILSRSDFLNSLIDERSFPWTKIFVDLERTMPAGVRIVSISPKLENGRAQVKLTFGASSDEAKIKFLEALEHSPEFSDIQLGGEKAASQNQGTRQPGANDRVEVELTAWYATI